MRIRSIKPEVLRDEDLWDLEESTSLPLYRAFTGLWCAADKAGRFEWRPRTLQLDILPYWKGDFSRVLDALTARGFLVKYASGGRDYGWVRTFSKHQVPNNKEKESILPPPPELPNNFHELTRDSRVANANATPLGSALVEGEGEGEYGKGDQQSVGVTADMWHVFNRWVEVWGKKLPATKFTTKRKRAVRERLKRYSLAELVEAVEGAHLSPHHLGKNDSGEVYDELELHLRSDEHLEKHRDRKRRGGNRAPRINGSNITPAARAALPEDYEADNHNGWPT